MGRHLGVKMESERRWSECASAHAEVITKTAATMSVRIPPGALNKFIKLPGPRPEHLDGSCA